MSECRTEMKPLPSFVMRDQHRLQVQVWYDQGLDPVGHRVQLKEERLEGKTLSDIDDLPPPKRLFIRRVRFIVCLSRITQKRLNWFP